MRRLKIEELIKAILICHQSHTCSNECPIFKKGGHEGFMCLAVDNLIDEFVVECKEKR